MEILKRRDFVKGSLLFVVPPPLLFTGVDASRFEGVKFEGVKIPTIWHDEQLFDAIVKMSEALDAADVPQENRWVWYYEENQCKTIMIS